MDESLLFRSTRHSASSARRPTHGRSRSLSTLSTRHKPKDSTDQLSVIRDHDLRTNIDAKVQRLARSLSRPRLDDDSARSRLRHSASFGRHHKDADIDVRTADHRHRTSSNYIDLTRDTHGSTAHRTQPPYAVEKLLDSSTALQQKAARLLVKDAVDRDIVPTGRSFDRITSILDQLRRADAVTSDRRHDDGRASSVRAELDSFAALISQLSPGSAAGMSSAGPRQTTAADDFWTRLAHTRGDLTHLETLVGRTFGSSHHATVSNSPPSPTPINVEVEPVFIFHDKKPSSRRDDLTAFVTGDTADYKKSDAIAEMAIKWAQERREKVENELNRSREYEDDVGHWQPHGRTARHEDVYLHEDLEPISAAVIHTSPTTRYHRSATVDLHGTSSSRQPSTFRSYTRSGSASVTGLQQRPQPAEERPASSHWHPTTTFSTPRVPMSAARMRARSVLAKHGRHLSRE